MAAGKGRIRHPKSVTLGGTLLSNVAAVSYKNNLDYNRDKGDDQYSGDPVLMSKAGSGSIELLAGTVPSCYGQGLVVVFNEVSVDNGAETVAEKTATFDKVTINEGANVPAEGRGARTIDFDYATLTMS